MLKILFWQTSEICFYSKFQPFITHSRSGLNSEAGVFFFSFYQIKMLGPDIAHR